MRWALLVVLCACGGAGPRAGRAPADLHAATAARAELFGAVGAVTLDERRVLVVAPDREGGVVVGVATIAGGRWDRASLSFGLRLEGRAPLAVARVADGALVAIAREDGVDLVVVDGARELSRRRLEAGGPVDALALAIDARGRPWCAFAIEGGAPQVRRLEGDAELSVASGAEALEDPWLSLAPRGDGVLLAIGARAGLRVVRLGDDAGSPVVVSDDPVLALAAPTGDRVAWADARGVQAAELDGERARRQTVDDGRRPGEPAHRVGAALTADGETLAYQDQTTGELVVVDHGGPPRAFGGADRTHGFALAIVRVAGQAFVLDTTVRATEGLSTELTVLRLPP